MINLIDLQNFLNKNTNICVFCNKIGCSYYCKNSFEETKVYVNFNFYGSYVYYISNPYHYKINLLNNESSIHLVSFHHDPIKIFKPALLWSPAEFKLKLQLFLNFS